MATPSAVQFISMWDYFNPVAGSVNMFEDRAEEYRNDWQDADLKAALKHITTVACHPNFPVYITDATALVSRALQWILKHVRTHEEFMEEYMAFILACIAAGPSILHISMMKQITYLKETQKHFEQMSGTKLTDFLEGLKKKFVNTETSPKEYSSELEYALRSRILHSFSREQCTEHQFAFVKLLHFYQSQVPESDEYMAKLYYTELVCAIACKMPDRSDWKELEKVAPNPGPFLYREQMQAIGNFLKTGKFPVYEKQGVLFKNCLNNIIMPILNNKTYFHRYLDDVMQLFCIVSKIPYSQAQIKVMDPLRVFFSKLRDKTYLKAKNSDLFERYAPMLTNLVLDIPSADCMGEVINHLGEYFLLPISAGNPKNCKKCADFIAACLTHGDIRYVKMCERFVKDNKKTLNWKDNVDGARVILNKIGAVKFKEKDPSEKRSRDDHRDPEKLGSALGDFIEDFLEQLKFYKALGEVQKEILSLIQQILEEGSQDRLDIAKESAAFIELKDDLGLALPLIETFDRQFKNEDFPWYHSACVRIGMKTLTKVLQAHKDPEQFAPYAPYFVSILKTAMNRDHYDYDSDSKTVFAYTLSGPLIVLAALYKDTKNHEDIKPLLGDIVTLLKSDDESLSRNAANVFQLLTMANPASFAPYLTDIVELLLENQNSKLLYGVQAAYKENPKAVNDRFKEVFNLLESVEKSYQNSVLMLLKEVADHSPQSFTKDQVNTLINDYLDNKVTSGQVFQLLQSLANGSPGIMEPHINTLVSQMNTLLGASLIPNILMASVYKNKKLAKPVFNKLLEHVRTCKEDYTYLASALNGIRLIAMEDKELLNPHKELFKSLGEKHPNLKDLCKMFVDVIEGKSFEDITGIIEQQQEDINVLDNRVTNTENEVKEIGQEVDSQGKQVGQLKKDVVKQEERIDELEEVVDDTVEKVEEIDKKTLSNAPAWSRDVSVLLNPEAEHDWRLLAQRLGYTPEDIRGWATQHDPCMSLLSEWFATHKTSEATKAVLKTLEEMNRLDAAEIVGRAMQAVENVVQDEPPDYETPPPVFISYQWAHQPEVRLFRKHLEMAGFASWMDIGQMGGGDKLYAKIDQGIRAAQVVICCVTEKYAKSPNCNREVNLAVNLGKPIIPLLLENVAWPPPGAMGPIFGEYLYIKFFQSGAKADTKDERVWPATSFQELLMQLSYMKLIPEQSKITKPYVNWWLPPEEVIVVKKKSQTGKTSQSSAKSEESKECEAQPEVFISYQWGIQPQVKALYKRMCGLGYHCWMDIHQMGGGDSLYDKIDRGVRGCKVVLSCVTEKYSKSANCRREVSLADALKKPIIPLLLEDTVWPPSGPMSMVFTQLLYIDFKDKKNSWSGSTFDELWGKVESYLSGVKSLKIKEGEMEPIKATGKINQSIPGVKEEVAQKPTQGMKNTEGKSVNSQPARPSANTPALNQRVEKQAVKAASSLSTTQPRKVDKPAQPTVDPGPTTSTTSPQPGRSLNSQNPPKTQPIGPTGKSTAVNPGVKKEPLKAEISPSSTQPANVQRPVVPTGAPTATKSATSPQAGQSANSQNPPKTETTPRLTPSSGSRTKVAKMTSSPTGESIPQSSQVRPAARPLTPKMDTRSKSCLIL